MVSVYPESGRAAWITALRPPRAPVRADTAHAWFRETERDAAGAPAATAVVLLTNRECPWRCLMCDLWRHTLPDTVPPGALPGQLRAALAALAFAPDQIKLYNSGSFFDPAAVPPGDHAAIAAAIRGIPRVVVECHPRLVGPVVPAFRDRLAGGALEVALGLETIHPAVLPRLNKQFTLRDFDRAAEYLAARGLGLRVFVLLRPPFQSESEGLEWAVRSAEYAFTRGATVVSLIPTRPGNGALDRLQAAGEFAPPRLATLERALEAALALPARLAAPGRRVFADTWDLGGFAHCAACLPARQARLAAMNATQTIPPPVACPVCGEP